MKKKLMMKTCSIRLLLICLFFSPLPCSVELAGASGIPDYGSGSNVEGLSAAGKLEGASQDAAALAGDGTMAPVESVIDNDDAGFSSGPGDWPSSSFIPGSYGGSYQYALAGSGGKWAKWIFTVNTPGEWRLYAQWTSADNRATAAPYTIINGPNTWTAAADQTMAGGQFNLLGTYPLEAGIVEVVLNDTPSGCVVADAVKIVFAGSQRILDHIAIEGPGLVDEKTSADYVCRAYYSDGTTAEAAADSWSSDCTSAAMDAGGTLTAGEVDADESCLVEAAYTEGDVTRQAAKPVIIRDAGESASIAEIPLPAGCVSGDGMVVAGAWPWLIVDEFSPRSTPFRWTEADGLMLIPMNGDVADVMEVSAANVDGSVLVGTYTPSEMGQELASPYRWTAAEGWEYIGDLSDNPYGKATDVSGDGDTVVGWLGIWSNPPEGLFVWKESAGLADIGFPVQGCDSLSDPIVSGNGEVVAFGCYNGSIDEFILYKWTEPQGHQEIGVGRPVDLSTDGSVIVGASPSGQAFRYTDASGMEEIGSFTPVAADADCSIVVGNSVVWEAGMGVQDLEDYLASKGVDLNSEGWMLRSAGDISDDGRIIVGAGCNDNGTIIDNADPGFASGPGAWPWSQFTPGGYNTSYQYAPPGDGSRWATWTFHPPYYGAYELFAHWTAWDNRATDAAYTVAIPEGPWDPPSEENIQVDQTQNGGAFNSLGVFDTGEFFVVNPEDYPWEITLRDTPSGYVVADAVKAVFRNKGWMTRCGGTGAPVEAVIDNDDAGFSSGPGDWPASSFIPGSYGGSYQYALADSGGKWAKWIFTVNTPGEWRIYAQWTSADNRATAAPYTIINGSNTWTAAADQTMAGGEFNLLGTYPLEAGIVEVVLNDTPSGCVVADAVKIVFAGSQRILDRIAIEGPGLVDEMTSADYVCRAYYSDGTTAEAAADSWSSDCASAAMDADGTLAAGEVDANESCLVEAAYTEGDVTRQAAKPVIIRDAGGSASIVEIPLPAACVSGNGAVAAGDWPWLIVDEFSPGLTPFRWTEADGLMLIPMNGDAPDLAEVSAINGDGSVMVGVYTPSPMGHELNEPYRWTAIDGWQRIGPHDPSTVGQTTDVSGDGNVVVGWFGLRTGDDSRDPFVWRESTGFVEIGLPEEPEQAYFTGFSGPIISGNGSSIVLGVYDYLIVENGEFITYKYTEQQGYQRIGIGRPVDLSTDGSVIVCVTRSGRALRYTDASGMEEIGSFTPVAANADCSIVIGRSVVWEAGMGVQDLENYLTSKGVDLNSEGWVLRSATDISDDGRIIVGVGYNDNGTIIDNANPGFASGPDVWSWSQFTPGGYNTSYQYAPPGDGSRWATWTFHPPYYGAYELFAQWTALDNRATDAAYTAAIPEGPWDPPSEENIQVDQTQNGGAFNSLGVFDTGDLFVVNPEEYPWEITLRDTPSGYVIADAVKAVFIDRGWMARTDAP